MHRPSATVVLAALTFVLSFAFTVGPDAPRMSLPSASAVALGAAAVVWLSGRRAAAALVLVVLLALLLPVIDATFEALNLVAVLVVFRAAMTTKLPPVVLACAGFTALTVSDIWLRVSADRGFMSPTVLYPALLTALAVGLGMQSRRVRVQHAELMSLREADRARAVSEERRRIARDLHDVAAHHLSALVVRNKLAQRVNTPESLQSAAEFTAQTAGDTLHSLREVVHVLSTESEAPREPQPGLGEIGRVLDRMEAAGLHVDRSSVQLPAQSPELDIAVVRIVQEALSNVLRHRGPGRAWLGLHRGVDLVTVTVDDDGPLAEAGRVIGAEHPGHYGIVGMRERAEACGGTLVVEASPRGGWRVRAELPAPRTRR